MMTPYRFPMGSWSGIGASPTLVILMNMSTVTYLWRYRVKTNQEVRRAMVLELSACPFPVSNLKLRHSFLHELVIYECVENGWISVELISLSLQARVCSFPPEPSGQWYVELICTWKCFQQKKVGMHACVWLRVWETFELNQLESAPSQLLPVFSGFNRLQTCCHSFGPANILHIFLSAG